MKKLITLFVAFIALSFAYAGTGWYQDYVKINVNGDGTSGPTGWFWIGDNPDYATQFDGHDFGTVNSFEISGCDMKYWSDTQDRTGGAFYYQIKDETNTTVIVSAQEIIWNQTYSGENNYQGTKDTTINLLKNLSPNTTYKLHIWAKSWGTGQGDSWLSNGGSNYVATFKTSTNLETGISSMKEDALILTLKDGNIEARFTGTAQIKLYSVTGQLLTSKNCENEFTQQVKPGVYLLQLNGKSHKIVVR
jgi:hypothetical protein